VAKSELKTVEIEAVGDICEKISRLGTCVFGRKSHVVVKILNFLQIFLEFPKIGFALQTSLLYIIYSQVGKVRED